MKFAGIHWHEGQFLHPHHFQAADRHWSEQSATQHQWDHPHGYGLQEIEINEEALANSSFEVNRLQGRLRDGTVLSLLEGQVPGRVSVEFPDDNGEESKSITVYVGVPRLKLGRVNTDASEGGTNRFIKTEIQVQDESQGGNDQQIEVRQLNVRFLLSSDELAGYDAIPVCRLKKSVSESGAIQIDKDYVAPLLSVQAWPEFSRGLVRSCMDLVGQKIDVLGSQLQARRVGFESRHPGDLDRLIMLSSLNAAYTVLSTISFSNGIHPFAAYVELCRTIGGLSVFSSDRRPPKLPNYDHDDLGPIFRTLRLELERLLDAVQEYEFEQRPFVGMGLGMQTSLEPKWFHSTWDWFVGVNKGELTSEECRDLLSPGQLDWKFGSGRQVEELFQRRAEGLTLEPLDRAVRALPSDSDWLYYRIPRSSSPAWQDVQATQTLAMRLRDSLILNQSDLQGERRIIVSYLGKSVSLEFSLFAVPQQS